LQALQVAYIPLCAPFNRGVRHGIFLTSRGTVHNFGCCFSAVEESELAEVADLDLKRTLSLPPMMVGTIYLKKTTDRMRSEYFRYVAMAMARPLLPWCRCCHGNGCHGCVLIVPSGSQRPGLQPGL
jgi:hypothetical protein